MNRISKATFPMIAAAIALTATSGSAAIVVPLGNLFDDAAATPINTAVASDTFSAQAHTADLGVEVIIDVSNQLPLNTGQTIAPGVSFNYASVGGATGTGAGFFARNIFNDAWQNTSPIRTTGSTLPTLVNGAKVDEGIGMHANGVITFNLDELRAAGALPNAALFTAHFDQNDDQANNGSFRGSVVVSDAAGNVIAGYVNGVAVAVTQSAGVWSFTGIVPAEHTGAAANGIDFAIGLPANAAYLTLAATSTSIAADHAVWASAQINYAPTISLGNLFDDTKPVTLTGTELWTGLKSDTYKATAQSTDLGVDTVQAGGLNAAQSLNSSGVMFNFTSASGGPNSSDGLANDAIGAAVGTRPPLRLDGPAGFPTSPSWETKIEDGIGIHANQFVTFDLDEVRAAGGLGNAEFRFTATAGLNDSVTFGNGIHALVLLSDDSGVVAGYIDGQLVAVSFSAGVWSFTGPVPALITAASATRSYDFDILIGSDIRYLTLAATGTSDITADHVAFVNANLTTLIPAPAALPAALALLAPLALRRRRR